MAGCIHSYTMGRHADELFSLGRENRDKVETYLAFGASRFEGQSRFSEVSGQDSDPR